MEPEQLNGSGSTVGVAELESLTSPFTESANTEGSNTEGESSPEAASSGWLASPFAEAFASEAQPSEASELEMLAAELEDLAFEEGIQRLVDEAAAMHLRSTSSWSSESEAVDRADRELESWFSSLASEADRLLEHLEAEFGTREAETIQEGELEAAAEAYFAEHATEHPATEQFLGGLVRKATKLVKGVHNIVKKGVAAVGKLLPLGKLFGALRRLVNPLLQRVLRTAINRLPVALRQPASELAKKLLGELESPSEAEVAATEFDARLAEAVLAPNEAEADHVLREVEAEAEAPLDRYDTAGELDRARARLVDQLVAATPGEAPTAEVEQFIPVVMAAMPIIRLGVKLVGRDKVVAFLGDRLADLVKNHIGPDMASKLGRPLADVGLRLLTLEAESGEDTRLGAEALVATMEDTIREVAALPSEALAEPLRLEAEVQAAFNESAARHVPASALRSDLPDHEAQEAGVWVFMPRRARPAYRYKKYSRVYRVPLTRPVARSVVMSDGATLERRLLDARAAGVAPGGRGPPLRDVARARSPATSRPSRQKPRDPGKPASPRGIRGAHSPDRSRADRLAGARPSTPDVPRRGRGAEGAPPTPVDRAHGLCSHTPTPGARAAQRTGVVARSRASSARSRTCESSRCCVMHSARSRARLLHSVSPAMRSGRCRSH